MVDSVLVEDEANRDVPKEKLARRLDFFDEDEFDPRMNVDPRTSSVMDSEIKNCLRLMMVMKEETLVPFLPSRSYVRGKNVKPRNDFYL